MSARAISRDDIAGVVRRAERDATSFAEEHAMSRTERNSYAYAHMLGGLQALGIDVDAIRAAVASAQPVGGAR